jgi:hypothetical protein
MLDAEAIRSLCLAIRARNKASGVPDGSPEVDDALVTLIEQEVQEYRTRYYTGQVPQLPPEPLAELLPLMGWLIYEASLDRLWEVATGFPTLPDERRRADSKTAAKLIVRLAGAARGLVWPEFAGRALGAIRAYALMESKRDTEDGFDNAWVLHNEADEKYLSYLDTLGNDPSRTRFALLLDEVFLQLALAETGTACRTAERVIGRWTEDFATGNAERDRSESEDWTQKLIPRLLEGVETGERALETASRIKRDHKFVARVDEERMTLATAFRNPAIMTCRAILLAYSMFPEMERLRREPPAGHDSWDHLRADLLDRFDKAYELLTGEVNKADGADWPLNADHKRSIVQICLHLALVVPRHQLVRALQVDNTLTLDVIDDDAVEAMSAWLAAPGENGKQRGDANLIGSSSKPDFNTSVEACRTDSGAAANYHEWRCRWPRLDRYIDEPNRATQMRRLLGCAAEPGA